MRVEFFENHIAQDQIVSAPEAFLRFWGRKLGIDLVDCATTADCAVKLHTMLYPHLVIPVAAAAPVLATAAAAGQGSSATRAATQARRSDALVQLQPTKRPRSPGVPYDSVSIYRQRMVFAFRSCAFHMLVL